MRFYSLILRCTLMLAVALTVCNLLALAVRFPTYAAIPAGYFAVKSFRRWQLSDAHGSARASGLADLLTRGMIGGRGGLILGTTGYLEPPSKGEAVAGLFSPALPSTLAVRYFLAAFCGRHWMGQ